MDDDIVFHENFDTGQVLTIMSIALVTIVVILFSMDPIAQARSARNRQRWAEVNTILSALVMYQEENGELPSGIDDVSETVQILGRGVGSCLDIVCDGADVSLTNCHAPYFDRDIQKYLRIVPFDPLYGSPSNTQYYINVSRHGSIAVGACREEYEDLGQRKKPPQIEVIKHRF